ncbi:bifunctional phosphoribosylaminoimidazolecarboxamide formyltransferase/IMP cyclohydrolase [bacterium]|nr:bifunctional phosphoribosylaminoimidazolecarboxamide formyltransferase/IMP cyclohydrolase [bacterium]
MATGRRALISVSDKTGVVDFARALVDLGFTILSTGGTHRLLSENGVPVTAVDQVTGFPEMMDGRVKTLHPKIHGALLGLRDNAEHAAQAAAQGIEWIDLVAVNLYPFEATAAKPGVSIEEIIENIDIGGPSMVRSAAKNHRFVAIVTDPSDYAPVLDEIRRDGAVSAETRRRLAVKAFRRTADYDSAIDRTLSGRFLEEPVLRLKYTDGRPLRYGENSHQTAAFYRDASCREASVAGAEIIGGKEMSFNNYVDGDAALEAVKDLSGGIGVAVIKHTNPCGFATGASAREALERAWAGDPISAFGSVIACNAPVDLAFAEFLKGEHVRHIGFVVSAGRLVAQEIPNKFVEVVVAPDFSAEALDLFGRSKTLRLLKTGPLDAAGAEPKTFRKITGGMLEMDRDLAVWDRFEGVTKARFDERRKALAEFTLKACKHTKSNAIVLGREYSPGFFQVIGMGAGQPNRVDSLRKLAVTKALENLEMEYAASNPGMDFDAYRKKAFSEMVLASDAFFPYDDTVRAAAEFGIRFIVQPGGSKRDADSIRACDELGIAMACTGLRHFRH